MSVPSRTAIRYDLFIIFLYRNFELVSTFRFRSGLNVAKSPNVYDWSLYFEPLSNLIQYFVSQRLFGRVNRFRPLETTGTEEPRWSFQKRHIWFVLFTEGKKKTKKSSKNPSATLLRTFSLILCPRLVPIFLRLFVCLYSHPVFVIIFVLFMFISSPILSGATCISCNSVELWENEIMPSAYFRWQKITSVYVYTVRLPFECNSLV